VNVHFIHTGIRVRELQKSIKFYTKVMGMKVVLKGKMEHGGVYVHLRSGNHRQKLELNWYPKDNKYYTEYRNGEELDHLAFWTENVRGMFKKLVARGAVPALAPFSDVGYDLAFLKDHDGIWIELVGPSKEQKIVS
jgi:lactoylglutathione lyase